MKADLHVHSRFSTRPSQWILQKLGCPESFTQPIDVYRIARKKGMDLVTITDHNTIDGVAEIAHLPGVFVSEEVTTYFPEDGCKVHVLTYGLSPDEHQDIQKIRENVYDLVMYLREKKIVHAVAHPLYSINDKLTADHFEKMLLLFRIFELNGARNDAQNRILRALLPALDGPVLGRLAEKHCDLPAPVEMGRKWMIGGSDDHSSLNIARFWTQVSGASDVPSFLEGIVTGQAGVEGAPATPLTMAHNLYGIAYQYYRDRFGLGRHLHKDLLLQFLERVLDVHREAEPRSWTSRVYDLARTSRFWRRRTDGEKELAPVQAFWKMSQSLVEKDGRFMAAAVGRSHLSASAAEKLWYVFVEQACDGLLMELCHRIGTQLRSANVFDVFGSLGSAGALYSLMAPFFVAFSHFTKDRILAADIGRRFPTLETAEPGGGGLAVAHFSDTILEVNGVARTLLQQLQVAQSLGNRLTLLTSDDGSKELPCGVVNFKPVGRYAIPEYPEISLNIPPFLEVLSFCYKENFTQIHAATPGPMGLAALAVGRILSLPIVSTYHTALPQYVRRLTGDEGLEALTWRYVIWYYNQMDKIYVPSAATGEELIGHGLPPDKVCTYPRGVDIERFCPDKRSARFRVRYGIADKTAAVYVGRLSKEKDLDVLCRAFRRLHAKHPKTALVLVGDGPYRQELEKALTGTCAVFTGYLSGEALSEAFASCDFLVFPSTTDTFGNVVLEAQASGIPVIVSDRGGPRENVVPGRTGWIFTGHDEESLLGRMEWMCINTERRREMGQEARKSMERRSFQRAFQAMWELFEATSEKEELSLPEAV